MDSSHPSGDHATVDKVQVFLLAHIILLSTDQVQVGNGSEISKLQDQYLTMLHRYLKYKYQRAANAKLAKGIMITSLAREALEIRKHRLPI